MPKNYYNSIKVSTLRYEMLEKLLKDNSTYGYKMGIYDKPDYFKKNAKRKRKIGVIKIWFQSPGVSKGGYSVPNEEHTATFPAYLDAWGNTIVVIDPLKVSNDPYDQAWQHIENIFIDLE